MLKFKLVKNFRKDANLKERLWGHFLLNAGDIRITPRRNLLLSKEYAEIAKKIQPGDLVLAGSKREISRFFLRGDLTHSLLYLGKKKFIHSAGERGVSEINLLELFKKYDYLAVFRHYDFTEKHKYLIFDFINKSRGMPYDFRFLQDNQQEFYCTKLVHLAYRAAGLDLGFRQTKTILPYLSTTHPEDLLLHKFDEIFTSQGLCALKKRRSKKWTTRLTQRITSLLMFGRKI